MVPKPLNAFAGFNLSFVTRRQPASQRVEAVSCSVEGKARLWLTDHYFCESFVDNASSTHRNGTSATSLELVVLLGLILKKEIRIYSKWQVDW